MAGRVVEQPPQGGHDGLSTTHVPAHKPCQMCSIGAGAAAGGVGIIVGQPFDTLKVRMQIASGNHEGVAKQASERGLKAIFSMYRGIVPPMMTSGFVSSLNFGGFELVRRSLHDRSKGIDPLYVHWLAGCGGALPVTLITCPIVLVKIQQQSAHKSVSIINCVRELTREAGIRGLYRGFGLHALLEGYGRGWYMLAYETSKRALNADYASGKRHDLPIEARMAAGAVAGVVGWLSIYPLDVLRSRINAQGVGGAEKRYSGVIDCARKTWREGGIRAFYKGLTFSMLRAAPVAAVVLPTFDLTNRWLIDLSDRMEQRKRQGASLTTPEQVGQAVSGRAS